MGYFRYFRRLAAGTLTFTGYIQTDGVNITTANNSWPCVIDYNADGKKDLLVGQEGIGSPCNVFVYLNVGTNAAPVFTDSTPVLFNGSPTPYYRTIPVLLDLDIDGKKDMILGGWYSDVRFYTNVGTNASPVFTNYIYLVNPDSNAYSNGNPPRLSFTDWDGDGDLDMLTCDYYGSVFLRRNTSGINVEELSGRMTAQNPFSVTPSLITGQAVVKVYIASAASMRLDLYTPDGRKVASLLDRQADAGEFRFTLDLNALDRHALSSGAYILVLKTGERVQTCKVQILR